MNICANNNKVEEYSVSFSDFYFYIEYIQYTKTALAVGSERIIGMTKLFLDSSLLGDLHNGEQQAKASSCHFLAPAEMAC